MYKLFGKPRIPGSFPYDEYSSIKAGRWRYATDEEIKAYNQGIRNINDIPKISVDNYTIY